MYRNITIRSSHLSKRIGVGIILAAALGLAGFVAFADIVSAALLAGAGLVAGLALFALPRLTAVGSDLVVYNPTTVTKIPWAQLKGATVDSGLVLIDRAGRRIAVHGVGAQAKGADWKNIDTAYHHARLGLSYERAETALQGVSWAEGGCLVRSASEAAVAINDELDLQASRHTVPGDPTIHSINAAGIGLIVAALALAGLGIVL